MTEKKMRVNLKKLAHFHGFSFYPLETRGSAPGIADLLFCGRGTGGVIELKILSGKRLIKVPYRPGQRVFLREHAKGNPKTYVLGFYDDRYYLIGPGGGFPLEYNNSEALVRGSLWTGNHLDETVLDALVDDHEALSYTCNMRDSKRDSN